MPDNIVHPTSTENIDPGAPSPTADPFSSEIDAVFGSMESEDGNGDGKQSSDNKMFGDASEDGQEDYSNLNSEQLARMFQSKYDKTKADLDKTSQKLQDYESLDDFIMSIYDDEEVRHAFLSDVAPDLVQQKDPYDALQERLGKEFGEDFTPDEEEAKKPLSKSWRYYKRLDDLYSEMKTKKTSLPKSLSQLKEDRAAKKAQQTQQAIEEKAKVLEAMKWRESDYNSFAQWVGKLSATDLAKIYKFASGRSPRSAPHLAGTSGGTAPSPNQLMAELDNFFGKN